MKSEFSFKIPRKDFGRILRWRRRRYLLGRAALILLLAADGVTLGLTARDGLKWWLIALIPVLALGCGAVWFFGFTDGGAQIYGDCKAVFYEDGSLTVSCKRESGFSLVDRMGFEKTMKIRRVARKGGYWIVQGEHRKWAAIPAEIPISFKASPEEKR